MKRSKLPRLLLAAAVFGVAGFGGLLVYGSSLGLGLRAQLGQTSGTFLHALDLYENGDVADALQTIEPLVAQGHGPSLNVICGFVNGREPVAATETECVTILEEQPLRRLDSLTETALWAQEWDVAADIIDRRLAEGDISAHFDKARLIRAAPSGRYGGQDLLAALQASAAAQDPRGQYAAVLLALDVSSNASLSPVLAEILDRQPKLRGADALFELAKLMQTGAVSSDLKYVEVLRRADAGGNPNAARYLAQYFIANPDQDPAGSERLVWMTKAASSGDPVAQYNLAVEFLSRPPETQRLDEVVVLLDRSATAGFVPAMNLLGTTLWQMPALLPKPAEEVKAQAMGLMQAAAAKDDVNANFNLGNILLSQQSPEQSLPYLRKAAALGSQPARDLLVKLGHSGG